METLDFVREQKPIYLPKQEPVVVDVPEMLFLMIDGEGQPDGGTPEHNQVFQAAVGALYGLVYTIKFSDKKGNAPEGFLKFKVPPLEGLWWMKDGEAFDMKRPGEWCWTLMIRVPDFVTDKTIAEFADELEQKKGPGAYKSVRLERFIEGPSVQVMHIGPYDTEAQTIRKMHAFAAANGYRLKGHHHELYFGDPRRTKPERLRTVLRQPVVKTEL